MRSVLAAFLVLAVGVLFLSSQGCAQSLADQLFLEFLPPNAAARAVTPKSIFEAETPIAVRFSLIAAIAIYEPQAACEPNALSFFGTRDSIPPEFCEADAIAVVRSLATYRALRREYPSEARSYALFLDGLNLDPFSESLDRSTRNGWANVQGDRIATFFANDGWNSLGDRGGSPYGKQQFQDFTGYTPANCPATDPRNLFQPLRWQPLTFPQDGLGRFVSQVHVVPHIGLTVRPLVLTERESKSRTAKSPYSFPNALGRVAAVDSRRIMGYLSTILRISARLTAFQRFLARWWNNKLLSTASISAFYEGAGNLTRYEIAQQFLGEMLAQHDAVIVTWREKRRFDLARPRTLLVNLKRGSRFPAFVSEEVGVQQVTAESWRPLINEQPHSEYPSGSAAICTAGLEHIDEYIAEKNGGNVPPIKIRVPAGEPPLNLAKAQTASFSGPLEAARSCGQSRLFAGVHFPPAIEAGEKLGKGIGKAAFEHIKKLGRGEVPKDCWRCERWSRYAVPVPTDGGGGGYSTGGPLSLYSGGSGLVTNSRTDSESGGDSAESDSDTKSDFDS